jgi:hypothetical protein
LERLAHLEQFFRIRIPNQAGREVNGKASTRAILAPKKSKEDAPQGEKGFSMWDLLSTLQKAIRRENERDALNAAWPPLDARTGSGFNRSQGGQLWGILRRITCEDIGEADSQAATEIYVLGSFGGSKPKRTTNTSHGVSTPSVPCNAYARQRNAGRLTMRASCLPAGCSSRTRNGLSPTMHMTASPKHRLLNLADQGELLHF